MNALSPSVDALLSRFIKAVKDVPIAEEEKAEVVINLAKSWGIDDVPLRQKLRVALSERAADHAYFFWEPQTRFKAGDRVRVIEGAAFLLGRWGHILKLSDPRRYGVCGMSRGISYSVVLEGEKKTWGFGEHQLESE